MPFKVKQGKRTVQCGKKAAAKKRAKSLRKGGAKKVTVRKVKSCSKR